MIEKIRTASSQRVFASPEAAEKFKCQLQAAGFIASCKPQYRTSADRNRSYKRRQTSLTDENYWPLQASPNGSRARARNSALSMHRRRLR